MQERQVVFAIKQSRESGQNGQAEDKNTRQPFAQPQVKIGRFHRRGGRAHLFRVQARVGEIERDRRAGGGQAQPNEEEQRNEQVGANRRHLGHPTSRPELGGEPAGNEEEGGQVARPLAVEVKDAAEPLGGDFAERAMEVEVALAAMGAPRAGERALAVFAARCGQGLRGHAVYPWAEVARSPRLRWCRFGKM